MPNPYAPPLAHATRTKVKRMHFGRIVFYVLPFSVILSLLGPLLIVSFCWYEQIGLHWAGIIRFSLFRYVAPSIAASATAIFLGWCIPPHVHRISTGNALLWFGIFAACTYALVSSMLVFGILRDPLDTSGWPSFRTACIVASFALTLGLAAALQRTGNKAVHQSPRTAQT